MPYATDSDLTTRIPATLAASTDLRALALADAEEMIDLDEYGGRAVRAHAYLAAHYLAVNPDSGMFEGEGGLVTSMSAGEISASFAAPPIPEGVDPLLLTTSYGRQFVAIRNTLVSHPEFV